MSRYYSPLEIILISIIHCGTCTLLWPTLQYFSVMWYRFFFQGFSELPSGKALAIDDVSFSKEPCKQIPSKQDAGEIETKRFLKNGFSNNRLPSPYYFWYQPSLFVCYFVFSLLSLPALLDRLYFLKTYLSLKFI